MRGYVVVFQGDDQSGYSAYSPDLPGVVAAGDTRIETEQLMRTAMTEHLALLREAGQPIPELTDAADITILDPAAVVSEAALVRCVRTGRWRALNWPGCSTGLPGRMSS